jgi:hypothetical protein
VETKILLEEANIKEKNKRKTERKKLKETANKKGNKIQ